MLAEGLLGRSASAAQALLFGLAGPRIVPAHVGLEAARLARHAWREAEQDVSQTRHFDRVVAALQPGADPERIRAIRASSRGRFGDIARAALRFLPARGRAPATAAPRRGLYLNASNYPLEHDRHVRWLEARSDITAVYFIHDLLPILKPHHFWRGEPEQHRRRVDRLLRPGSAAIVASEAVEHDLRDYLSGHGRRDVPVFRRRLPVDPAFLTPRATNPALTRARYFVMCGTIEPRKNHMLLLRVWRTLIADYGADAPRLVLVGKRGWLCDEIIAKIESPALRPFVIEAGSLSTPDYKTLLDHCVASLCPSRAEGFGLPLAEAIASRTRAIASDIAPFREIGGDAAIFCGVDDDDAWLHAIKAAFASGPAGEHNAVQGSDEVVEDSGAYLARLSSFLQTL
jgi:glycosyltransferase involved in cell wall biosynthesis